MFTHLHVHSDNSLFDGYETIDEIVNKVKSMGQSAVALTDHGTMAGCLDFYLKCKSEGIKPILGCEFYFCEDKNIKERSLTHHLVLLAKNKTGYYNLKKLNMLAYDKDSGNYYYKPRIDSKDLPKYTEGVVCLSACLASIVNTERGEYWVQYFKNLFGDDFYLELQPHPIPEQDVYNHKLLEYCDKYGIKPILTTDAHYANRQDAPYHKYWVGLQKEEYYQTDTNFLWSEEELYSSGFMPKFVVEIAIKSTQEVADKCNVAIEIEGNHFPKYPTKDACKQIRDICRGVWRDKVPKGHYKEYGERFNYELEMLDKCGYTNYLLLTWDFLNWCHSKGILTGCGRGSIGGSVVAWLLGIHYVDPIKHGLLFERFCNPERVSSPDIDNDVQTSRRGESIEYLKETYGNVMKVRTYSVLSDKSAVRRAGQVLEIELPKVLDITKRIETIDDIKNLKLSFDTSKLVDIAEHFKGRLGAFGSHASAVLITPDDTLQYVPIESQTISDESLGGKKIWTKVASGDFHVLEEEFGLMKLDVLGLNTLDVIDNVLKSVHDKIDIYNLPTNDDKVFEIYRTGDLLGVFQCDSTGMRQVAKDIKVSCFEDIVSMVALYRPGPIDSGMLQNYIDGKNGQKPIYLCKEIEEVLSVTHNVILYQEQVMKLAQKLGNYTLGKADMLRKIIGRKEEDKIEQATKELKEAIVNNGFTHEIANYVGDQVRAAGRYIFNKSHATAYGYLSYVTAYLKVYYPREFMCALINSKKKQEDVVPYIDECKRMKIKVLPPDLRIGNKQWLVEKNSLRVGLTYIKNVGNAVEHRYTNSFENIVSANNKRIMEGLIKSGAVDFLGLTRGDMLGRLTSTQDYLKRKAFCETKITENKSSLASATDDKSKRKYERQLKNWQEKLQQCQLKITTDTTKQSTIGDEIEVLGFSFEGVPRVKEGVVKSIYTKNDKNGREMAWVTFNSSYGDFRCVCFASKWKLWKKEIGEGVKCKFACGDDLILQDFQA